MIKMKRSNNNNLGKEMNWTKMEYPESPLHELFTKQAEATPLQ